jgi:HEAT repeat protein
MGTPTAIRALVSALGDPDLQVADAAAQGLQKAGIPALSALEQALGDSRVGVRLRAVAALQGIPAERTVALLRRALQDADARVQRAAADALGAIGRPEAVPALIAALGATDGGVALNAARSLAHIGKPAIPALLNALRSACQPPRAMPSLQAEQVAYFAAMALSQIPEAEAELLRLAQQPATQRYALIALKERRARAALPLFKAALQARDPATQQVAREALMLLAP